ncbi:hypothetical protein [Novosphingobium sp. Rr 2-17]|uniref:hypothetical protein n=1 Tax=Novosphingobium sp. Rr 2-17 TaxID=555793 RepID=UPI001ED95BCE|nr:hypothetical protein [Novosphingobium sp. Rr 2-17]
MHEPSIRGSRQVIAAGLLATALVGGTGFLLGRSTVSDQKATIAPTVVSSSPPEPVAAPNPPRTLGRAELLELARQATDAQASGTPMPQSVMDAADKRFELTLPFGCSGPSVQTSNTAMGWQINEDASVIRIWAKPATWPAKEWGLQQDDATLAGFWIERPWSSRAQCSVQLPAATAEQPVSPTPPPGQTLAIAQLSAAAGRAKQRGFETVERVATKDWDASAGLILRLIGKLENAAAAAPVHCIQPAGAAHRPMCVLIANFEEVRIENVATGEVLAVWDERSVQR